MAKAPFDSADYELVWPRGLFRRELEALLTTPLAQERQERVGLLLSEAFLGEQPVRDLESGRSFINDTADDPWGQSLDLTSMLLDRYGELREHRQPRPYWPARHGAERQGRERSRPAAQPGFASLINEFRSAGYLDRVMPRECVDASDPLDVDPSEVIEGRLGLPDLWPLQPRDWDEDTFFGLIEVFHDLVARPRARWYHSWNNCGWHYSDYSTDTGRALYRWRVNRLLDSSGIELRLAEDGEDLGRLVHVVDDARTDLIERALTSRQSQVADRIAHAVALFRRRGATEHDKRSAAVALALVLEERRKLLKTSLFRADEGALFRIANEFDVRHREDKQHSDYDPAFRDWVFWWYLATVELTDRLLDRQRSEAS